MLSVHALSYKKMQGGMHGRHSSANFRLYFLSIQQRGNICVTVEKKFYSAHPQHDLLFSKQDLLSRKFDVTY